MSVPLLDVNAQNLPLEAELTQVFEKVLKSGRFILGPEIEAFEKEIAALAGARHGISMSSGTDALIAALMALDIGEGDEVICPSFTFFATAGAVWRVGATPVFVDVCPVSFNINVEHARKKVTARTKAIIPVHLFGQSADMDAIMALANEHGLHVIEDAAQAMGASYRGRGCGSIGHFGCYSYFPSKNLGGFGDSGLLVTSDDALADRARWMRNHGMNPKYYHKFVGGNFRMDELQAALLRVKLRHFDSYTERRRANAEHYTAQLLDCPGVSLAGQGSDGAKLILPVPEPQNHHIWNQYTLRLPRPGDREALRAWLVGRQIGCETYYPVPLHQQECFATLPPSSLDGCAISEALAQQVISIPVYPELDERQRGEVVAALRAFLTSH